jgi:L-lactate dehydrogenase complex protein LldG
MTAREEILGDVGRALVRTAWDKASIAAEARTLLEAPDAIRPSLPTPSAVESFLQRVVGPKVGATVDRVSSLAGMPGAVARFLAEKKLDSKVALQPTASFTSLDWARAGVMLHNEINEGVVVGLARWGIAETGSLVFHSRLIHQSSSTSFRLLILWLSMLIRLCGTWRTMPPRRARSARRHAMPV